MRSLLSESARSALLDIRRNIAAARAFVAGVEFDAFEGDLKGFYAVTRALEIISEASRRLPDSIKAEYPGIPWQSIRDAGNAYRHAYNDVEAAFVWETVQVDLPILAVVVDEVIAADDKVRQAKR